jgi:hypothetical protein
MCVPIQSYIPSSHHTENFCEVGGFHSGSSVYLHLPRYEAVSLGEWLPTFRIYDVIFPKRRKHITGRHGLMSQKMQIISEDDLHDLSFLEQKKYTEVPSTNTAISVGLP